MADNPGAAAAVLTDPAATTPTTPAATTPTTPTTPAATETWYSGATPELQGLVEKKGWKDLSDSLKSYAELEKQFHGDKIPLPKDENDADGWNKVYTKLGRPEKPEDYKAPEGTDEAMVKALSPELYKAGITQKQFDTLAKIDIARQQNAVNAENTRFTSEQTNAMQKLETEWGSKFNENIEVTRRAMRNLGISVDDATRMMQVGGTEKFMRLLNLAGVSAREDNAGGLGDAQLGFGMTANRAKAELASKKQELLVRAHKGDKAASAELDRLYKISEGYAGA